MFAPPAKVRRRVNAATPKADAPTPVAQRAGAGTSNQAALRRLANGGAGAAPPIVHDVVQSAGKPLAPAPRAFFEAKLGADLGAVRLHDDARAARSAKAIGALAYAAGPLGRLCSQHRAICPIPRRQRTLALRCASKITDPSGKGPSSEDLNKGLHSIFDKKEPKLGLNNNAKFPDCSKLELSGSTAAARKYWTFEQYDLQRKMSHSPLRNDPWPQMLHDEYNAAIASYPKGYRPVNDEPAHPAAPRPDPAPDMPPLLPPGQAYA
jgi:Domain of unknown function (DUF4157)